ncbi:putative epoxidase LasC [Amycolatopsis sp. M39]|nr:putative epoxidase LasC [Amycolatopsis sp. M39]
MESVAEEDHAVVIGGSMAGLLAARALADRFKRVTVVERDQAPARQPAFRRGVPHSRHVHIFWHRGLRALETLLPGACAELLESGARILDAPADVAWHGPFGRFPRIRAARFLSSSRELIDAVVRRRVAAHPGVRLWYGREVVGLHAEHDGRSVRGVEVRNRGAGGGHAGEPLEAGFVIDATGRGSRASEWLRGAGCAVPGKIRYESHFGYASRYYSPPEDIESEWNGLYIQASSQDPHAGAIMPIDGGRWIATLGGVANHAPPSDEDSFLEFARNLGSPAMYEALVCATPLSTPVGFRNMANERYDYSRRARWPAGFAVVGDALCCFNPVYGQGLTTAALSAVELSRVVRAGGPRERRRLSRAIQRAVAAPTAVPWLIATGEDLRYPTTEGPRARFDTKMRQRYVAHVAAAATVDPVVTRAYFRVLAMEERPGALLSPRLLRRVLLPGQQAVERTSSADRDDFCAVAHNRDGA